MSLDYLKRKSRVFPMSITPWPAAFINLRPSSGPESYSEALPWAVSNLGRDLRPSGASRSWQQKQEVWRSPPK